MPLTLGDLLNQLAIIQESLNFETDPVLVEIRGTTDALTELERFFPANTQAFDDIWLHDWPLPPAELHLIDSRGWFTQIRLP
jgi:hypothetical protein